MGGVRPPPGDKKKPEMASSCPTQDTHKAWIEEKKQQRHQVVLASYGDPSQMLRTCRLLSHGTAAQQCEGGGGGPEGPPHHGGRKCAGWAREAEKLWRTGAPQQCRHSGGEG